MPHPIPRTAALSSQLLLAVLLVVPINISIAAVWIFDHANAHTSLFALSNLVGPTTHSLLQGAGLTACTDQMGTPGNPICFHAGRMPLPSLIVALGIRLLGDRYLPVAFLKALLFLLPLEAAIYLVWTRLPRSPQRRLAIALLLLLPFIMPAMLADVVNLQVEEGYSYSLLALAAAILFFHRMPRLARSTRTGIPNALLFALAAAGLYLAKSSMAPAVAVLLVSFLWLERRPAPRLVVLLIVLATPIGWAIHQHHASGRYSIGTSIDGINLHKANNPEFLKHYPPPPGDSLDRFDSALNRGHHFNDEWSFNDYHQRAALTYLRIHPRRTLHAEVRKLSVIFLSIRKYGSSESHGSLLLAETAGLFLFRLILWTAILCAVYNVLRPGQNPSRQAAGIIFLALIAACALPYLAGFAYTRHVSILIYPSTLLCCRMLLEENRSQPTRPNSRHASDTADRD